MTHTRFVLPWVLLFVAVSSSEAQSPPDAAQRVDAVFESWNALNSPGCAVAVSQNGLTVLSRAYGMADLEHDIANTPGTIFEAGSVSKQFTAAAVVLLALDGKLRWTTTFASTCRRCRTTVRPSRSVIS